jgi:hypothetical protein
MDGPTQKTLRKARRELTRRVIRQFAGVEYVRTLRHADGTATVTFITYDDNADEVMESLADVLDDLNAEGVRVLVFAHE